MPHYILKHSNYRQLLARTGQRARYEVFKLFLFETVNNKLSASNAPREPVFSGYVSIPLAQFKHGNTIDGWYTLLSEMGEPTHGSIHLSIQFKIDHSLTTNTVLSSTSVNLFLQP